ncbi:hypothetical protein LTR56_000968 [Elasticomyces elasticus]|nr:hypothetical protein LTR22_013184 [Elasticomyces elasticus]KAK3660042.1 hypothetical protein LTR56_000968 [Elasticomyces elasticus]KAK4911043.1 hypothetical protein LTR49_020306 [Elasticomyces elasticus]KAK5750550.1 hypothetical protein LTS12_019426 [Elasticomyces elasticus]
MKINVLTTIAFVATSTLAAPSTYDQQSSEDGYYPKGSGIGIGQSMPTYTMPTTKPTGVAEGSASFDHPQPSEWTSFPTKPTNAPVMSFPSSGASSTSEHPTGMSDGPAPFEHSMPSSFKSVYTKPTSAPSDVAAPEGRPSIVSPPVGALIHGPKSWVYVKPAETFMDVVRSMEQDGDGFVHFGDDGIARSYRGDGTVLDARALSNGQLADMMDTTHPDQYTEEEMEHLRELWQNVDGHDVKDESQLFHPAAYLRPPPDTEEQIEQSINAAAAMKKMLEGRSTPIGGVPIMIPNGPVVCAGLVRRPE